MYGLNIFRAVVEDNQDPLLLGRVRIRVVGVHSGKLKNVKTDELPWSSVIGSLGNGNGFGSSINILVGSWVYCFNLNEAFSDFIIIGSLNGIIPEAPEYDSDDDKIGFRDPAGVFPLEPDRQNHPLIDGTGEDYIPITVAMTAEIKEAEGTLKDVKYPNNKVYADLIGNTIQIDASEDNPRIVITHATGSRISINKDGDISLQSQAEIYCEGNLNINGNLNIDGDTEIKGNILINGNSVIDGNSEIKGDITVAGTGNIDGDVTFGGNLDVSGDISATNVNASGDVKAGLISLKTHTHISATAGAPTGPPLP